MLYPCANRKETETRKKRKERNKERERKNERKKRKEKKCKPGIWNLIVGKMATEQAYVLPTVLNRAQYQEVTQCVQGRLKKPEFLVTPCPFYTECSIAK
jgi:hypothetical protein